LVRSKKLVIRIIVFIRVRFVSLVVR
jgi:hypothetical protein